MRPKIKICGITNRDDALMAANLGAHLLGFIFYEKSPRYIDAERAAEIIRDLPHSVIPVGVFVNETRDVIKRTITVTGARIIQLSGDEVPGDCLGHDADVWKAFRLLRREEAMITSHFSIAAAVLDGARNGAYGGGGTLPDFDVAMEVRKYHPLVLAGGLRPENIVEAIQHTRPEILDVNSGVESYPGKKDPARMQLLFQTLASIIE